MQSRAPHLESPRSRFVTRVARLFITLSMFGLTLGLFQGAMLLAAFGASEPWVAQAVAQDTTTRALVLGFVLICALTLVLAFALLRRKPWARGGFVALMACGAVYHLVTLCTHLWFRPATPVPSEGPAPYLLVLRLSQVIDLAYPALAGALCFWVLLRLRSPAIRQEFRG